MTDDAANSEVESMDDASGEPGATDQPDASEDGQPELEGEQKADLDGLSLDGDALDPDGKEGDRGDSVSAPDGIMEDSSGPVPGGGEWGDMYVSLCQQATNQIIEKHGDGHTVEENHFRSIDLDDHFNAVVSKYSESSEMEPEQALVVGTAMAVGGPVMLHTNLLADLAGEFEL